MSSFKTVWTALDLGAAGWLKLHELARLRRRPVREQTHLLVLFALDRALAGEDVELSQARLEALLKLDDHPD